MQCNAMQYRLGLRQCHAVKCSAVHCNGIDGIIGNIAHLDRFSSLPYAVFSLNQPLGRFTIQVAKSVCLCNCCVTVCDIIEDAGVLLPPVLAIIILYSSKAPETIIAAA